MDNQPIQITEIPSLKNPILIIGFDGWGNAMNIAKGMVVYLIRKLKGKEFAKLDTDTFYRYDASRPWVSIIHGVLNSFIPPGGTFYAIKTQSGRHDIVILKAEEPNLRWFLFTEVLFDLCRKLEVNTIITLGSMHDNVLHSDKMISGVTTCPDFLSGFVEKKINLIYYQGPGSIHSIIQSEARRNNIRCMNLWCHCPYYLQDMVHFGMLSHLGGILSFFGEFDLDLTELDASWEKLKLKIDALMKTRPEVQELVDELQKERTSTLWKKRRSHPHKNKKIIHIEDFRDPD